MNFLYWKNIYWILLYILHYTGDCKKKLDADLDLKEFLVSLETNEQTNVSSSKIPNFIVIDCLHECVECEWAKQPDLQYPFILRHLNL